MSNNLRRCVICKRHKSIQQYPNSNYRKNVRKICLKCQPPLIRPLQGRSRSPATITLNRKRQLQEHGLTAEEFSKLEKEQHGVCAICKLEEIDSKTLLLKTLVIDHCHKTGAIRGLLCNRCNTALGLFKDQIPNLQEAIKYLSKYFMKYRDQYPDLYNEDKDVPKENKSR